MPRSCFCLRLLSHSRRAACHSHFLQYATNMCSIAHQIKHLLNFSKKNSIFFYFATPARRRLTTFCHQFHTTTENHAQRKKLKSVCSFISWKTTHTCTHICIHAYKSGLIRFSAVHNISGGWMLCARLSLQTGTINAYKSGTWLEGGT